MNGGGDSAGEIRRRLYCEVDAAVYEPAARDHEAPDHHEWRSVRRRLRDGVMSKCNKVLQQPWRAVHQDTGVGPL